MLSVKDLKERAKNLKAELLAVYYAYRHPEVGFFPKLIIALALAYAASPIDLIPDFIPVIGLLDDIDIVPALILMAIKFIPEEVMRNCREKAEEEPVALVKNWFAAAIFVAVWIAAIYVSVKYIAVLFA